MACDNCRERKQDWAGDPPRCGFEGGVFTPDNFRCATLQMLREAVHERAVWCGDQAAAVVPLQDGEFLVLGWYKDRGRTEFAGLLNEGTVQPLTLTDALGALVLLTAREVHRLADQLRQDAVVVRAFAEGRRV